MAAPLGEGILRRTRRRRGPIRLDETQRQEAADRVLDFYQRDMSSRSEDRELRLQRYAKYRQWTGPDDGWPWPGSSNQSVPDMMEGSIRTQDTLHNAVMSARPVVVSRALSKEDESKQAAVDALHDTQFFVEQKGERTIEHAAESFVNDPAVTFFIPWVRETRENVDPNRTFAPIPFDQAPGVYFGDLLRQEFPEATLESTDEEGWDWDLAFPDEPIASVKFYTQGEKEGGEVEMVITRFPVVFDGPRPMVKDYDDVICPPGVANLDIPGPSNPGGSPHVILRDYPTRDEIDRLQRDGVYDLISREDVEKLDTSATDYQHQERRDQQDTFAGENRDETLDKPQGTLTRLMCFDVFDVDGDEKTEDVIFWVVLETKKLLRAKLLTEVYPGRKPKRPFAEASFLPVGGRRAGISLLEIMEGLHDSTKEAIDQMIDNGTLANLPWFTYRASSSLKPETLRPGPGDGIPTNDPKNDLQLQQFSNQGQAFWLNLVALFRQSLERLTLQGDLQAGRVPTGKASALRTLGGIQTILGQGEARPERILRRFFMALTDVFAQMYRLNRYFLPEEKRFRASLQILEPGANPYFTVAKGDMDVDLDFDFHANVNNSSKAAVQQGLEAMMGTFISEIAVQMGITTPDNVYKMMRDYGQSLGRDVEQRGYITQPTPMASSNLIVAEEAVAIAMEGGFPDGEPAEGAQAHLAGLQQIMAGDLFGAFPEKNLPILNAWLQKMVQRVQLEQQAAAQQAAAGPLGQSLGPAGQGNGTQPPAPQQPELSENELIDETLPTAGGGGNA